MIRVRGFSSLAALFLFLLGVILFTPKHSLASTSANTLISNQAEITFVIDGENYFATTNAASFRVDEIINHTLVTNHPGGLGVTSPDVDRVLSFTLSNTGNGSDTYDLSIVQPVSDDFNADNVRIYLDADADGIFDINTDTLLIPGTNDPSLAAGESLNVFVVSDVPAAEANANIAQIDLTAVSSHGNGSPGDVSTGTGDGGVDVVIGGAGGSATDSSQYSVTSVSSVLSKSQRVLDPLGGNRVITDSIITYTLLLEVTGSGTISSVVLKDVIPTNSTYELGSITLNNEPLTDAVDADQGVFTGSEIQVSLGSIVAPTTASVTFRVRVL